MTGSPPPVFLSNTCNGGETRHVLLVRSHPFSTIWLSNDTEEKISTSACSNNLHSNLRIQVFPNYLLLSVWENVSVTVDDVVLPISTSQEIKSFILTDDHSFTAPSGRWEVEFDYDYSISNSMRPPPLPVGGPDADPVTVSPADLLINSNGIVDEEEVGGHDIKAVNEGCEDEKQQSFSPRARLSQLDNLVTTSQSVPSPTQNYSEEPTQQLPRVQNLAQLREIAGSRPDDISGGSRDISVPAALDTKLLQPDSPAEASELSAPEISTGNSQEGVLAGTKDLRDVSAALQPVQAILELNEAVDDDELTVTEPKTETGCTSGIENTAVDEPSQKLEEEPKIRHIVPQRKRRDSGSPVAAEDRLTKRRRTTSEKTLAPTQKDPETSASPHKRKIRAANLSEAGTSRAEPEPANALSIQRKVRRRVKTTVAGSDSLEISVDESDTVTAATDDRHLSTPPRTRSASVDGRPRPLATKPKIVLSSSLKGTEKYEKDLKAMGATFIKNVIEADVFCIPDGDVKKTLNFVLSLIHGKFIVTETWLKECTRTKKFDDPMDYLPDTQDQDATWNLAEALERGRNKTTIRLLDSWSVFVTNSLKKQLGSQRLTDQGKIAKAMGANFRTRLPTKQIMQRKNVLVLGTKDDWYVNEVQELGHPLFQREILTMVALRGTLDLNSDEFKVQPQIKVEDSD